MATLSTGVGARIIIQPRLTPEIRLRLKMLQAPRAELDGIVADALAENPFIEEVPWELPQSAPRGLRDYDSRAALESVPAAPPSLLDELLAQLRDSPLSAVERRVGESILGNLDEDGFLETTIEEIALQSNVWPDLDVVEQVLAHVQEFDPPGIAARDRVESFVLQLRRQGFDNCSLPVRLVRECLSALVRRPLDGIARALGVSTGELLSAARLVARLDPSPGRREQTRPTWIVPDVTVQRDGGDFVVIVNEEGFPRLRLRDLRDRSLPMRTWRQSAQWLLAALDQRRETLHAVTSSIVRAQHEFLEGRGPLRPLALREVAREVGRHESTVSRAISDKYIATPLGTLALKAFFVRRTEMQGSVSADQVKVRIAELLASEDKRKPLTDEQIVRLLCHEHVRISRRTIGKYREELGEPPAAVRRSFVDSSNRASNLTALDAVPSSRTPLHR